MSKDSLGNFKPVDLEFSSESKERWVTFYNEYNEETHNLSHEYLAAAWSKLEVYAARLALIVNCIRSAQEGVNPKCDSSISLDSIKSVISLVSWFKNETKRIYGLMTESENIQDSRKVMNWIEQKGGAATIRYVTRVGLCGGNSERLNKAFTTLIQSGIGSWQNVKPKPRGGRETKLFILNCETDKTDESQC